MSLSFATILCSRTCRTVPSWHCTSHAGGEPPLAAVGSGVSVWHGSRRGPGPHPHQLPHTSEGARMAPTDGWSGVREPLPRLPPHARLGARVVDADAWW